MEELAIVIVNYKVPYFVAQCLRSVEAAAKNCPAEVWVVDNNSEDDSVEYLQARFPWVHFIANSDNVGFARANNQAIRASKAPFVLLLNPDTIIGESTLSTTVAEMKSNPKCGALGVRMLDARGNFLKESKRGSVSPRDSFFKIAGLSALFPHSKFFNGYYMGHLPDNKPCEVGILAGAFMLLRREALNKSGLLDERYFMYGEDIDLSYSIRRAGYSCRYLPIPILHYKGESESAATNRRRYLKAFYGAMQLFYDKYHPNRPFSRKIVNATIRLRAVSKRKSRRKPSIKAEKIYKVDLRTTEVVPSAIPAGSLVCLSPSAGLFDRLLVMLEAAEGRDLTFLTHYPCEGITLGPGGPVFTEI